MYTRRSLAIVVAILILVGLVAALQLSAAQDIDADSSDRVAVSAVAAESVTEYEPDPFEPERLRSSTVRVKRVAVVYSDGSVEVKRCE
ncbi:MAG: hypothetical protein R6V07_04550 [Armatimonadota bacterium]